MKTALILGVALAAAGARATASARPDTELIGPLRIRDMTPFNLLRLDMLPAHAVIVGSGTWAIETDLSYASTFIMSDNVRAYLEQRGGGRKPLTQEDVDAIFDMGEDAYYVDGEFALLDITVHHALTDRSSIYLTLPVYDFAGGFLDRPIENFHDEFSINNDGRDLVARNQFQTVVSLQGVRTSFLEPAINGGVGDPVVGLRHGWPMGTRWTLVLDGAAKFAVHGEGSLLSTGGNDVGLQASLQGKFKRQGVYISTSTVWTDGDVLGVRVGDRMVPTLTGAYEIGLTHHTNAIFQVYASKSTISDTTIEELKANKYEASLGFRSRRGRWVYGAAVIENFGHFENTPDFGLSLTLAWILPRP